MSKRAGAVPEETKAAILEAAREEFSVYGFQKSSLRRICAAAGVTTGALYFFFEGKDDLFASVIEQTTGLFNQLMAGHYQQERACPGHESEQGEDADYQISRLLIAMYFQNRQTWDILLHHLDHPAVQRFLDDFVEKSTDHYVCLLQDASVEQIDRFAIHQFVHMQVDSMLTLISHDFTQMEMIAHAKIVIRMLRGAFRSLLTEEK